jgi:hypothetical protein
MADEAGGGAIMGEDKEQLLDELLVQLHESDRYIDLDLMAAIMAQGAAIEDRLIEVVAHDDDWASVHAMMMLIEMRSEKALPAISQALLEDPDLNEWVDNEGLDKYGPVAIDTLEMMVREEAADWYPRAIAASALVRIAARYPETYERITAILRDLLPAPDTDADEAFEGDDPGLAFWPSVVSDLSQLRDPAAYALIGQLFDADLVDPLFMDRADYERLYQSTDPLYGEKPEPGDLLSDYQAAQEAWRRSEEGQTATTPPALAELEQMGLMPAEQVGQKTKGQPVQPSRREEHRARKQARKSQRKARRAQRKKRKKKKKR